ncbi:MFS transporter [Bacillus sp. AGMB 02131]|uniref:MFS transporter n=1 Tax=Peribacillus faecalis TaxID=2772559 RepID=A0A927CZF9_9BACI|nr:MFS transporter [Peribacillus faecalis]MBD3110523.1 MFS transporter [Peribacillus faecalis]
MPRNLWFIVIGMVINVTGSSFLWPLNTIYLHDHLGKSLSIAGLVLMVNAFATVIGNLIGGFLFDKIGGYRSIVVGAVITLSALIGLTINHGWPQYVVWMIIIGFGSGLIFPAMYAMAGSVWKEGGRKAFNAVYVAQNLGVAVGSALGGLIASFSFDYIFAANMIMYVIFLLLVLLTYKNIESDPQVNASAILQQPVKSNRMLYALLVLCTGYLLCWVGYVQWTATISAYTQEIGVTLRQYSLLWTINGALIVLGQPFVNKLISIFMKKVKLQMIVGMIIFMGSFAIAAFATNFSGFLTAMLILTIGEMLVWPAVPTIASELSPKGKEGFYQGIVNSTATAGRMIGPLLGGLLVDFYGMQMMFFVLMILFVVAIGTTLLYDKLLSRTRTEKVAVAE